MVSQQIEANGLTEPRVLQAMAAVPRHAFVLPEWRAHAYEDRPLPIGFGQTISQPYIVALMTHLLALKGGERVLEIGTGSGYQAAVLAVLARWVFTIERHAELAQRARETLRRLGYSNVTVLTGDGSGGVPDLGPYDGILVPAAAPVVPQDLLAQLVPGGRLVLPVGGAGGQTLEVWTRQGNDFIQKKVIPVAFVPLRGKKGWSREDWENSRPEEQGE